MPTSYKKLLTAIQASDSYTAPQAHQSVLVDVLSGLLDGLLETQRAASLSALSQIAETLAPIAERCATEALNTAVVCMNRALADYAGDAFNTVAGGIADMVSDYAADSFDALTRELLPLLAGMTDLAEHQASQLTETVMYLEALLAQARGVPMLTPIAGLRPYIADGFDDDPDDHTEEAN